MPAMKKDALRIDVRAVTLVRGGTKILKNISWQVRKGEHWVLMGNNGSGKTTLLEVIMGYLWPQRGTVRVLGECFGQTFLTDLRKRIGFLSPWVFDRTRAGMRVENIVASGREGALNRFGKLSAEERKRVREKLRWAGGRALGGRAFGDLSSGEQFKVMLARALMADPEILILDEPFSLLDFAARMDTYRRIRTLARSMPRMTVILVTHHLDDIQPFFTHAMILCNGRSAAQGEIGAVLSPQIVARAFGMRAGEARRALVRKPGAPKRVSG